MRALVDPCRGDADDPDREGWKAAEARCGEAVREGRDPDPEDLRLVDGYQAAWDAEHPEGSGRGGT